MGDEPPPEWESAEPPPVVVGGWPQTFYRYSRPVVLYRRHDSYVADWLQLAELVAEEDDPTKRERDRKQMEGLEYLIEGARENMRELDIVPPKLPAGLAHLSVGDRR